MKVTLGEIKRHIRLKLGLTPDYQYLKPKTRRERFSQIYETGAWRHGRSDVPGSGEGSTLEATKSLRSSLPDALRKLGTGTLLDIGCGDFHWMKTVALPAKYIGLDIVESVIQENRVRYASEGCCFDVADAVTDPLPEADTVLIREVLFHLSLEDALSALSNILSLPRRYFIITHDRDTLFNSDILTGDFRLLNFERAPFRFPSPRFEVADNDQKEGRVMAVWSAEDVRMALAQ